MKLDQKLHCYEQNKYAHTQPCALYARKVHELDLKVEQMQLYVNTAMPGRNV